MKRKILVMSLAILVLAAIFNYNKIYSKSLDELRAEYRTGDVWTGRGECHGFAVHMYTEFYGITPSFYGVKVKSLDEIQAGDLVRYTGNVGHSVWITSRNGDRVSLAEANYDWNNGIRWRENVSIYEFSNLEYVYKAPYPCTSTPPTLSAPSNIKATVESGKGVKVSWDIVDKASAYDVKIYRASDVARGDFSKPVVTKTRKNALNVNYNFLYVDVNLEGEFCAYVHTRIGNNVSPSGGSPANFTITLISSISVTPERSEIVAGESTKVNVTYYPQNANNNKITFSSSDTSVATVGPDGKVYSKKAGKVTIYAKSTNGVTGSATINIKEGIMISGIYLNAYNKTLKIGQTFKLYVTEYIPADATYKEVEWVSADESIATVDENGLVTAISEGKVSIRAVSSGGISIRCSITVEGGVKVTDVVLDKSTIEMTVGNSENILATVLPADATNKSVVWTTSDSSVAVVENGKVTALKKGEAVITAKSGVCSKSCQVKVYDDRFKVKYLNLPKLDVIFIDLEMYEAELESGNTAKVDIVSNSNCVIAGGSSIYGKDGGFATIYGYDETYGELTYICFVNEKIELSDGSSKFAGDLNGNNRFDTEDVQLLRGVITKGNLSSDNQKLCDINGDHKYDTKDIELLNRIVTDRLITIQDIEIEEINLNEYISIVGDVKEYTIDAEIYPENTTQDKTLTYTSSDTSIATIDKYGTITVIKPGKVKFTVTATNGVQSFVLYDFTYDDVTNKDKTPPVLTVSKNITTSTKGSVIVTISANKEVKEVAGWSISEDKLKLTKTYTENKTEDVEVQDMFGNKAQVKVVVDNIVKEEPKPIDKTPPTLKVSKNVQGLTHGNVVVTITANEKVIAPLGWTLSQDGLKLNKTYSKNSKETVVIKDISGNIATITITVDNIIPFKDVKLDAWYIKSVKYCYENGIINGTSSTTFSPDAKLTRGMLVTILYGMEGKPKVNAQNKFSDVSSSMYYYMAVLWASNKGIVNGSNGKFRPDDNIKREDLAVILMAYSRYKKKYVASNYVLTSFSDYKNVSSYAGAAMRWTVKNQIIKGSNGKLNPKGTATRAEAVTMIYSYILKFGR